MDLQMHFLLSGLFHNNPIILFLFALISSEYNIGGHQCLLTLIAYMEGIYRQIKMLWY